MVNVISVLSDVQRNMRTRISKAWKPYGKFFGKKVKKIARESKPYIGDLNGEDTNRLLFMREAETKDSMYFLEGINVAGWNEIAT